MTQRLLFTSGRGPAECRIALAKALARMTDEACAAGLDVATASGPDGGNGHGPASVIALVSGDGADAFVRRWTGAILWVCQSPVRPHHRRKNWYLATVALPPLQGPASLLAAADVRFETFRAGGPGGQHQNKTESAVRATHLPSGLSAVARDGRSQHRNKALALERLAALIASADGLVRQRDLEAVQAAHDRLERGGTPVRRFEGPGFVER